MTDMRATERLFEIVEEIARREAEDKSTKSLPRTQCSTP
jgi:hypothetical protein